jgi:hypothetical protein
MNTKQQSQSTTKPWEAGHFYVTAEIDGRRQRIASAETAELAAQITREHNAHDDLVAALEAFVDRIKDVGAHSDFKYELSKASVAIAKSNGE